MENINYLNLIVGAVPFVIVIAAVLIGRHKGFAGIILSFILTVAGMVFAREYADPVAEFITNQFIHKSLCESIAEKLISGIASGTASLEEALPSLLTQSAVDAGFSADSIVSAQMVNDISEKIALACEKTIIMPVITCISFILILALAKIIGKVFVKFADLILKLPIISQANEGLGAAVGALMGIIVAAVAVIVMVTAVGFFPDTAYAKAIGESKIIITLYEKIQLLL